MSPIGRKTICLLLALSMSVSPSMVLAAQAAPEQTATNGVAANGVAAGGDLSYIIPEATIAGVVYPRRVLTNPSMEMLPLEVLSAAGIKEAGIDPMDVEQVTVMIVPPAPMPGLGIVVRFTKPYELKTILPKKVF